MFCKFEKVNNTDGGGHDQNSDDDEDTLAMMSTPASRKRRAEHSLHYPRRWAALVAKSTRFKYKFALDWVNHGVIICHEVN